MIKLPFLNKLAKKGSDGENFLAVVFNPFKVYVAYMELVDSNEGGSKAQIVSAISRFISSDSFFEDGGDDEKIVYVLQEILQEMEENFSDLPSQAIFGVSSEFCIDLMSIVRLETSAKDRFTEEQLNELSDQAQKNGFFRAQDILAARKGDMDTSLELITSVDIFKKIDGGVTRDPIGLEGKELELSWFGSFAEDKYLKKVQRIAKQLNLKILTVSSLTYAFYSALYDLNSNYKNCVIINLNTVITEVSVAFGGGLVGSRFINLGVVSILEQISTKLDLHYDEAEEVLQKYKEGSLDSSIAVEIQKIIRRFFVVWSQALSMVFTNFSGIKTFSSKVLLTGSGFDIPDIYQLTSAEPWFKSVPFKSPPTFEKAPASNKLKRLTDLTGKSSSLAWTLPLSLSSVYYELRGEEQ